MTTFLQAFIPTVLFMMIPIIIPVLAVVAGAITDRLGRSKAPEFKVENVHARRAHLVSEPA